MLSPLDDSKICDTLNDSRDIECYLIYKNHNIQMTFF